MSNTYQLDWGDMAFGSKKPLNSLKPTFIAAPRELSAKRFTELVKTYLPAGNIILGIAKEDYIAGFEDQPQFRALKIKAVQGIIDKVNSSKSPHKVYVLNYYQTETAYIFEKCKFIKVVLVNGSWLHTFHTGPLYFQLVSRQIPFEFVSPFCDEIEAKDYAKQLAREITKANPIKPSAKGDEATMLQLAQVAAKYSYDYSYQTGLVLAKKQGKQYQHLLVSYNEVVPYETFALHHGNSREKHLSPSQDLNHYDTVHAEIALLNNALRTGISLKDTTIFINLLPCPTCSRALAASDLSEVVYQADHSNGYAVYMLEKAGKTVRRVVADFSF
jgi:deoxycytidylate deaminase